MGLSDLPSYKDGNVLESVLSRGHIHGTEQDANASKQSIKNA